MSTFPRKSVAVCLAMVVTDFIWAKWMASVAGNEALHGALWSTGTILLGGFVTISYVHDRRLLVPAAVGGFIGTYIAMVIR